ncbi:MAG: hypothetical protein FWF75_04750 [Propionibacteriaceae bacterium]|nr:hypothetical protein [Propionibacteriaceae bacterium]
MASHPEPAPHWLVRGLGILASLGLVIVLGVIFTWFDWRHGAAVDGIIGIVCIVFAVVVLPIIVDRRQRAKSTEDDSLAQG